MRPSTTSHPDAIFSKLLGTTFSRIILRRPHRSCSRLGKRTRPEVSSDRARRASYQRHHRSMMNQSSRPVSEDEPELGGLLMDEEEPAPQDPLTPAPLEKPPVVIGAEPVPESELPAPVLEHRSLSVLERCIALRIVYGRSYS